MHQTPLRNPSGKPHRGLRVANSPHSRTLAGASTSSSISHTRCRESHKGSLRAVNNGASPRVSTSSCHPGVVPFCHGPVCDRAPLIALHSALDRKVAGDPIRLQDRRRTEQQNRLATSGLVIPQWLVLRLVPCIALEPYRRASYEIPNRPSWGCAVLCSMPQSCNALLLCKPVAA
jgi:hypothetical protein